MREKIKSESSAVRRKTTLHGVREALASMPIRITVFSGIPAVAMTAIAAVMDESDGNPVTVVSGVGFTATVWALLLACLIFVVTSKDTQKSLEDNQKLHEKVDSLTSQVSELTPVPPVQSSDQLQAAMEDYRPYVHLFETETGMDRSRIVSISRPGDGKGNRPVIVATDDGHLYSVFRGRGETVTMLDPSTSQHTEMLHATD